MTDACGGDAATLMGLRGGGGDERGTSAKAGVTAKPFMFSGKGLERLSGQLTELFPVWVLISVVVGITKPSMVTWLTPNLITMAVSAVMVFTGMTLEIGDFQEILKKPSQVALGCVCQFGIMPFLSSGIVRALGMQPDIAAGVILLGSCPGGTSSNLITLIAGGDVALSVLMTSASTILAPFLTSTMVGLLAGAFVDIDMLGMFKSVRHKSIPRCRARAISAQCKAGIRPCCRLMQFQAPFFDCFLPPIQVLSVVLGPVFAGITINRYFPGISKMTKKITPLLSVFLVSLICGSVIGTSAGDVKAAGLSVVAAVVAVHMG